MLEAHEPVGLRAEGGQHDHGHVVCRAEPTADFQPADAGKHQVEHDQIRPGGPHCGQCLLAVGRLRDVVSVGAQVGDDHLAHCGVVVHDQDPATFTLPLPRGDAD